VCPIKSRRSSIPNNINVFCSQQLVLSLCRSVSDNKCCLRV
jgi:hypothetical protein